MKKLPDNKKAGPEEDDLVSPDKLFYELNLLRIEGLCFDFSKYRGKGYKKKTEHFFRFTNAVKAALVP